MGGLSLEAATVGLAAVLAATMALTLAARMWVVRSGTAPDVELSLYQVAMLAGGPSRVSDTALSYLTWSGMLEVRESTDRLVRLPGMKTIPDMHPVELSILAAVDPVGVRPEAAMGSGRQAARETVSGLGGLVVEPAVRTALDLLILAGCGAVVAGAVWWTAARDGSSAGFVPLLGLTAFVYAAWWFAAGRPRVSGAGLALLEQIREKYDSDLQVAAIGVTSLPVERAMHVIALYGRDALTGGLSGLRKVMTGNPAPTRIARSSLVR